MPNPLTEEEKHDRLNRLIDLVNEYSIKRNQEFIGKDVLVLVDDFSKTNKDLMMGYSEHNKVVNFIPKNAKVGDIVKVRITEAKTWFLNGYQIEE